MKFQAQLEAILVPFLSLLSVSSAYGQTPYLVRNIHTGFQESSAPLFLTAMDGALYFQASDASHGFELWKSDGTTQGTEMVKDLVPGIASGEPRDLFPVDGQLFFTVDNGTELWVSDGTTVNTDTVITFQMFGSLVENAFASLNGELLFVVNAGGGVNELWKSDGTVSGTSMLRSFAPNNGDGISGDTFFAYNGEVYFMANDGITGREVWKTDGSVAGTILLKDIHAEAQNSSDFWDPRFTLFNGLLFFGANEIGYDHEPWRTDGSNAGTIRLKDVSPGLSGSGVDGFTVVGANMFFTAIVGGSQELWVTDGTTSGTVKVTDIAGAYNLMAFGSLLIFTNNGVPATNGHELWKSDGTAAGTQMIKDILAGPGNGIKWDEAFLTEVNGQLFFRGDDGVVGTELWRSDGTSFGTVVVKDLYPGSNTGFINNAHFFLNGNDRLFFDAVDAQFNNTSPDLWTSDGTDAGTYRLPINIFGDGSFPSVPVVVDDLLFLAANSGTLGRELWAFIQQPISTSSEATEANFGIDIHPNPSAGRFSIQVDGATYADGRGYDIRVLDLLGRPVLRDRMLGRSTVIEMDKASAGTYMVELSCGAGCIVRRTLIIQ